MGKCLNSYISKIFNASECNSVSRGRRRRLHFASSSRKAIANDVSDDLGVRVSIFCEVVICLAKEALGEVQF